MTFGEALRACRNGRSLRDLAAEVGITHSNLSKLERGEATPSQESFDALREAFPGELPCPMCGGYE